MADHGLHSNLGGLPQDVRFSLGLAASLASSSAGLHRFPKSLSASDAEAEDVKDAQAELNQQQKLAKELQRQVEDESAAWLTKVVEHLEIDRDSLPPHIKQSDIDSLKGSILPEHWFDLAFELVFVSLGLGVAEKASQSKGSKSGSKTPPLSDLTYTALDRSLSVRTLASLGVDHPDAVLAGGEKSIAQSLYFALQQSEQAAGKDGKPSAWAEEAEKQRAEKAGRGTALKWAATGAGFVLGGVAIGLTGGLAAPALVPLLAGGLGMSFFGGAGGAILIGTLLGLGGGGLAGYRTHRRMKGLDKLEFEPIVEEDVPVIPSLTATICASGYLLELEDSVEPWRSTVRKAGVDAFAIKADADGQFWSPVPARWVVAASLTRVLFAVFLHAGKALDSYVR